jgi:hypothetical protein
VDGLFEAARFAGGVLVTAGLVMILMTSGGTDERMSTQVPLRRFARYPIAADAVVGGRSRRPTWSSPVLRTHGVWRR